MSDKQTTMTDDEFVKMFCYIMEKTNNSLNKEKKIECDCGCFGLPTRGRAIRWRDCRSDLGWPCWCSTDDCFELFDNFEKATDFGRLSGIVGLGIGELQGETVASGGLVGEGIASGGV